jgi:shikimate kinase
LAFLLLKNKTPQYSDPLQECLKDFSVMNIILFGFKKCGKTYYGLKVAQKLHMHFVDSDLILEEIYEKTYHQKLSYREIAKKHGFPFFRKMEKQVVSHLMQQKNSIISIGGGMVLDPDNVARLHQTGTMVYLKTSKATLEHRTLSHEPPAYIDPQHPLESFEALYNERLPIYEGIAAHTIDTEGLEEKHIIDTICHFIHEVREQKNGQQ